MLTNRLIASVHIIGIVCAAPALGATIHVPSEAPTIAAAVQIAADGDVIELAPGVYSGDGNRDMLIETLVITVRGAAGSERTIIDCEGTPRSPHRAFEVTSLGLTLEGVTIRNGSINGSGGALLLGGGTYVLSDCAFDACSALEVDERWNDGGGAVAVWNANALTVDHCRFTNNLAEGEGGALLSTEVSEVVISDSTFESNSAWGGGALTVSGAGNVVLERCTLGHNSGGYVGALWLGAFSIFMQGCLIHDNEGELYSVGVVAAWNTEIAYSTFVNNVSSNPRMFTASLFLYNGYVRASILWDDDVSFGHSMPVASCVKGWSDTGLGCTSADPLFVDPANEDYHLQPTSPLIDYGGVDPLFIDEFDLDGNPRQVDLPNVPNGPESFADLGCFEVQLPPLPADLDGNGVVNASDLAILLGAWGGACDACPADLNFDGEVNAADLAILLGSWS